MNLKMIVVSVLTAFNLVYLTTAATSQTVIGNDAQNLSGEALMLSLASQDVEKRTAAQIYLTGITDATVGTKWCGYDRAKSITIRSLVYDGLRAAAPEKRSGPAAPLVVDILAKTFPCGRTK